LIDLDRLESQSSNRFPPIGRGLGRPFLDVGTPAPTRRRCAVH
jgi:hypothetical protein